jgi:hypothetical protein
MTSIKSVFISACVTVAFVMGTYSLNAQQLEQISEERLISVQGGTAQLTNGHVTIALSESTLKQLNVPDAAYMVVLTPIGDCGQLKLQEKSDKQFVVQEYAKQGSNNTFDYVVFVKKKVFTALKLENASK